MTQKSELASSVDDFLRNLPTARTRKTFVFADLFNSTEYKIARADNEWVPTIAEFYRVAVEKIESRDGEVLKFLGDAVMATFDNAGAAIQAAIDLQEALDEKQRSQHWSISCKIGIATGDAYRFATSDGKVDYLGVTVDLAARLCDFANGKAILLSNRTYNAANIDDISSGAGRTLQRSAEQYFGTKRSQALKGIKEEASYYALFWQASPEGYLTTEAVTGQETPKIPITPTGAPTATAPRLTPQRRLRGKLTRFLADKGYGFITYSVDGGAPQDIWFHRSEVLGQATYDTDAVVHFIPEQDANGRLHAVSVVILGSGIDGKIVRHEKGRFGFLSAKDSASNKVDFFFMPSDVRDDIVAGDNVQFVASENLKGLLAKSVHKSETQGDHNGHHLDIGSTEHGVVDTVIDEKGFAFVSCRGNRVFSHYSEIRDPERVLHVGETVEFTVAPGKDGGYRAVSVHRLGLPAIDEPSSPELSSP